MSFLGKLFGADEALEKVIDTADKVVGMTGNLIDEAFDTDQEKAERKAAAAARAQSMVVEWVEASTGSRLARRVIAFAITGVWLGLKMFALGVSTLAVWANKETTVERLGETATLAQAGYTDMTPAVMLILGFYFAAPYMGDLAHAALEKFGKSNSK